MNTPPGVSSKLIWIPSKARTQAIAGKQATAGIQATAEMQARAGMQASKDAGNNKDARKCRHTINPRYSKNIDISMLNSNSKTSAIAIRSLTTVNTPEKEKGRRQHQKQK